MRLFRPLLAQRAHGRRLNAASRLLWEPEAKSCSKGALAVQEHDQQRYPVAKVYMWKHHGQRRIVSQ
eukprot:Skav226849  [mRNA]  locus=scaffold455:55591:63235:+ [translate_table: standard]